MVYRQFNRLILGAICASSLVLPAFGQSTNKEAKKLGRKGIYGTSSLESIDENGEQRPEPTEAERKEAVEKQKRLKAKYPLSRTSFTAGNQRASQLLFKGIQQYREVRARFDAINEISSSYEEGKLEVKQKGIIPERVQLQDLVKYGPTYAHIGLKIRALQSTDKLAAAALANFSQARALAPTIAVIPKWVKIAADTRKALQYHAKFYQISVKAIRQGYEKEVLERLALQWSNAPKNMGPNAEITTRIYSAQMFEKSKTGDDKEAIKLDDLKDKLPNLEFEAKNF